MKKVCVLFLILLCLGCGNTKEEKKKEAENTTLKKETISLSIKSYVQEIEDAYVKTMLSNGNDYSNHIYYVVDSNKIETEDKKLSMDLSIRGNLPSTSDKGEIFLDEQGEVKYAKVKYDKYFVTYCNENKILFSKEKYLDC